MQIVLVKVFVQLLLELLVDSFLIRLEQVS